jgi:outer membrane lipoprotein-sorting protein
VGALVVAVIGVANVRAAPAPPLPPVPADQLLASTLDALAHPFTISGDVNTHLDLGLPQLPSSIGGSGVAASVALVTGDQRFRVWRSPEGVRVAHLLDFREQDLVANDHEAWLWDSQTMTAVHATYPVAPMNPPSMGDVTAIVSKVLGAVAPYADVSVDGTATVAGRPCYELVLTPRSNRTRVGRIVVAIDAQTRLPLRFQVFARGADTPAIEGGFATVSFDPIDPAMFTFTPPPSATVKAATHTGGAPQGWTGDEPVSDVRVFGDGFDLRVALRLDASPPKEMGALLPYAGPLASAVLVERGDHAWLLVGFVDVATLQKDAAALP